MTNSTHDGACTAAHTGVGEFESGARAPRHRPGGLDDKVSHQLAAELTLEVGYRIESRIGKIVPDFAMVR
jgi:hypothetical protein